MPTVLILGASRGIGYELASQYRQAQWRVIATVRDDDAKKRLTSLGCEVLQVDLAQASSSSGLAWQLDGEKLDLAIYCAGVMDRASAPQPPTQEAFDHVMHTNVMGAMQALPQILPMVEAARGTLVCLSSVMGSLQETGRGNAWLYRVSKAALNMVVRCLQAEQTRVTVLAMHPGWVQTDMGGAAATLTVTDSVSSIRQSLERIRARADSKDRGAFFNHDGASLSW